MMVLEILVRMCKFRMRYNTLHKENTAKRKNNILYLGNEGYRKAFSFFKKKILGKRKRIYNNISYLGNEGYRIEKEEGRGRNLGFASGD